MTALQDWLNVSRVDPHRIKGVIRAAWRRRIAEERRINEERRIAEESGSVGEPQLMGRGRERC